MNLGVSAYRYIKAIFSTEEPILIEKHPFYRLEYPASGSYISWEITDENYAEWIRRDEAKRIGLKLPDLPIVKMGWWWKKDEDVMTSGLIVDFLRHIGHDKDFILRSEIVNPNIAKMFRKLGGLVMDGRGFLLISNGRPVPFPVEKLNISSYLSRVALLLTEHFRKPRF